MSPKFTIQFSPTRLKQMKKIALSGSRAKLKILNGKMTEGFQILKTTAQKFKSFATDLADRIPKALAARISLDLFSHFEQKNSKRLGIPKGIVLGGVLALMASLPAVGADIIVANNNDVGVGSLREAINTANGTLADDRIILADGVTYTILSNLPTIVDKAVGGTLEIICLGTNATINGNHANRPLTMATGSDLTISNITVQNGFVNGNGGAIYNYSGDLRVSNSMITTSQANGGRGGGIYSSGKGGFTSVLIQNSTISLNSASLYGGGIFNYYDSPLTISSSSISGNTGTNGGGGIYNVSSDNLTISSSSISGNTSDNGRGGGIYNRTSNNLTISSSSISGNTSNSRGAGILNVVSDNMSISNSVISGNTNTSNLQGGGIFDYRSNSTSISNSTISNNTITGSGAGAGIAFLQSYSAAHISNSTISGNIGNSDGGGVWISNATTSIRISNSTISGNTASKGAGVYNSYSDNLSISSSSISGNTSSNGGGGIYNRGSLNLSISSSSISGNADNFRGGGIYNRNSDNFSISSSSISGNTSGLRGGGIYNKYSDMAIQASSIALNVATSSRGGGIYLKSDGGDAASIINSTISNNDASAAAGGGIYAKSTGGSNTLTLQHVTISDNSGTTTGGFANDVASDLNITMQNTIIANSTGNDFARETATINGASVGNIIETGDNAVTGVVSTADPLLNALSGGVQSLQAGSPAIDLANAGAATANDQLGTLRVAPHDIGAVQFFVACPIDVTSNLDAGVGTLRQAIIDANSNISDCVIYLDGGETYTIASNLPIVTGTDVGGKLSIISTGTLNAVIDGVGSFRPLTMDPNSDLTLSNITVQNGFAAVDGGAIFNNHGDLKVSNSIITNNRADTGKGGGIFSTGLGGSASVLIENSTISLNRAISQGGGIYNRGNSPMTISSSSISGNIADNRGGGIYNNNNSPLTISSSSISGNKSYSDGGGIANLTNSVLTISSSPIFGNEAAGGRGGGIYNRGNSPMTISSTSISGNTSTNRGGGIYCYNNSPLTISSSSISGNTSNNNGGGICNSVQSPLIISSSSISGNSTTIDSGGGIWIYQSNLTIQASSLTTNQAATRGGGMFIYGSGGKNVLIQNTTISGNTSTSNAGGGIYHNNLINTNTLTLQHVTISNNSGAVTGGFGNTVGGGTANITLQNTIIANSTGADFDLNGATLALVTATISGDGTLSHPNASSGDPLLGALTLNSGFLIHPVKTTSPAIDAGTNLFASIPTDEVGNARDTSPHIGAVEVTIPGVCMVVSAPAGVTNTWIGCTNSDWNTATNWSTGAVPTASDVVYIPIVAANQLIIDEVAVCRKMIVQIGAKCIVNYNAGGKLLIKF